MTDSASPRAAAPAAAGASARNPEPLPSKGMLATAGAFLWWGLFPIYLKALQSVPAVQIVGHRIVWCCVLVTLWMAVRGELPKLYKALTDRGIRWRLAASGALISINWLVYAWAVNTGHVVETSLGYFINPLVNVLLGVVVLSERLNRVQWMAIALAAAAVVHLTIIAGHPPWIALVLALSFGSYGLIRKITSVDATSGLAAETLLLLPFAAGYLIWCEATGSGALGHSGPIVDTLLIASGVATAVPLVLFAYGARRIPYSTVGVLQYIAPSMQLALGVLLYGEPFGPMRAIGFALIWTALVVYVADGVLRSRRPAGRGAA